MENLSIIPNYKRNLERKISLFALSQPAFTCLKILSRANQVDETKFISVLSMSDTIYNIIKILMLNGKFTFCFKITVNRTYQNHTPQIGVLRNFANFIQEIAFVGVSFL